MAKVKIQGHASGTGILTVTAPNTSSDRTITLPDETATLSTFDPDGAVTINDTGADVDFRVESNNVANMLFVNGGTDMVLMGTDTPISFDAFGSEVSVQVQGAGTAPYTGIGVVQNSNDGDGAVLILGKSRGTSVAATTVVQDGDYCGRIEFQGMDGSDLETCATILGEVDGTPGSGDMPGRLIFRTTADGAEGSTERLRITQDGRGVSQFTAKAWWRFDGTGTVAIADSHNISSVGDTGTGDYRIYYDVDLDSPNHSAHIQSQTASDFSEQWDNIKNQNAAYVDFDHKEGGSNADSARIMGLVFGD